MDPLSITAAAIGLIAFTIQLSQTIDKISGDIKQRSTLLQEILEDLELLQTVLKDLSESKDVDRSKDGVALLAVFNGCKSVINQIDTELCTLIEALQKSRSSRFKAKLTFSTKMESIASLRMQLEKYKATLLIALNLRTMKLTSTNQLGQKIDELRASISTGNRSTASTSSWQNPIQQYLSTSLTLACYGANASINTPNLISTSTSSTDLKSLSTINTGLSTTSTLVSDGESQPTSTAGFGSFDDWLRAADQSQDFTNLSGSRTRPVKIPSTQNKIQTPLELIIVDLPTGSGKSNQVSLNVNPACTVASILQELQAQGYDQICGFYTEDNRPVTTSIEEDHPVCVKVTSGPSKYSILEGLCINKDDSYQIYYEDFLCANEKKTEASNMSLKIHESCVQFQPAFSSCSMDISLSRTLRVPDNGTSFGTPVLFSPIPIFQVDHYKSRLPPGISSKGGIFIPLHQREALALKFDVKGKENTSSLFAIKCLSGTVNVVSGEVAGAETPYSSEARSQGHIIVPEQLRLDGFAHTNEAVRQFVAMSLGSGHSVEAQRTGKEVFGGMQLLVAPPFRGSGSFGGRLADSTPAKDSVPDGADITVGGTAIIQCLQELDAEEHSEAVLLDKINIRRVRKHRLTRIIDTLSPGQSSETIRLRAVRSFKFVLQPADMLNQGVVGEVIQMIQSERLMIRTKGQLKEYSLTISPFGGVEDIFIDLLERHSCDYVVVQALNGSVIDPSSKIHDLVIGGALANSTVASFYLCDKKQRPLRTYLPQHQDHSQSRHSSLIGGDPASFANRFAVARSLTFDRQAGVRTSLPGPPISYGSITTSGSMIHQGSGSKPVDSDSDDDLFLLRTTSLANSTRFHDDRPSLSCGMYSTEAVSRRGTFGSPEGSPDLGLIRPRSTTTAGRQWNMGLGLGGLITQSIVRDREPTRWNWSKAVFINIQFVSSVIFEAMVGIPAPPSPVSFKDYIAARLPFYHLIETNGVGNENNLSQLKSIGELDAQQTITISSKLQPDLSQSGCQICEENLNDSM